MQITFYGAVREVTGSMHLLSTEPSKENASHNTHVQSVTSIAQNITNATHAEKRVRPKAQVQQEITNVGYPCTPLVVVHRQHRSLLVRVKTSLEETIPFMIQHMVHVDIIVE